jgi:hypothetical protein
LTAHQTGPSVVTFTPNLHQDGLRCWERVKADMADVRTRGVHISRKHRVLPHQRAEADPRTLLPM